MKDEEKAFADRLHTIRAENDRIAAPLVAETDQLLSGLLGDADGEKPDEPESE